MPALDQLRMGEILGGWDDKGGKAARYDHAGSPYRTYKPWVTNAADGAVTVSTKIDHIRDSPVIDLVQDDHCLLTVTFDSDGEIVSVSATMKFAEVPQFDPILVEKAVIAAGQVKYAAAAKVAAEVLNSLAKFITNRTDHGGRLNFPTVVKNNIDIIWKCVAEDPATQTPYEIKFVTGQLESAGTDAGVHIILFGEYGNTGQFQIDNRSNNFERGQTDTFVSPPVSRPNMKDLGDLQKIRISHDSYGEKSGWFLETVTVINQAIHQSWDFPCHSWLDSIHGTSKELFPDTKLTRYEITVVTGNVKDAGTGARVYMKLIGSKGDSENQLDNLRNNFERGQTDRFEWQTRDLGDLKELYIRHDNRGEKPGWFLDRIIVRNQITNETWLFPCEQWLAADAPDGRIDRRLLANLVTSPAFREQNNWRWCRKCQGLAFGGSGVPGPCPAGATHDHTGSGNYTLVHDTPGAPGQSNWRWCRKCQGLAFGGSGVPGACPAGATHDHTGSGNYTLVHDTPGAPGQSNWRWCQKCQGLAFGGSGAPGPCPAGTTHDHTGSGNYSLRH